MGARRRDQRLRTRPLDTMLTVVDASTFLDELVRGDDLAERDLAVSDTDERAISDLLVDQVEVADTRW